ncbi:hypothetical protein ACA910_011663 [Epithemia clementina (nom. ined.)]
MMHLFQHIVYLQLLLLLVVDAQQLHPDQVLAQAVTEHYRREKEENENVRLGDLRHRMGLENDPPRRPCAEYMNHFFSEGPSCFQIRASTFTVAQCVEFPITFSGNSFTRYFNLTSTPDGLVTGNWGTIGNNNACAPNLASEALVGIVDTNDCSFVLVETNEITIFTGTVGRNKLTYTQAQPGALFGVSKGTLYTQDFDRPSGTCESNP